MDAGTVLETLDSLANLLDHEVAVASTARGLIGRLDVPGLSAYASHRSETNAAIGSLQERLCTDIERLARAWGLSETSVGAVAAAEPRLRPTLQRSLERMRRGARALAQIDARFCASAARTQGLVRSYLSALRPVPSAYTRRGGAPGVDSIATHSRRA